jgi:hypothetical protein
LLLFARVLSAHAKPSQGGLVEKTLHDLDMGGAPASRSSGSGSGLTSPSKYLAMPSSPRNVTARCCTSDGNSHQASDYGHFSQLLFYPGPCLLQ